MGLDDEEDRLSCWSLLTAEYTSRERVREESQPRLPALLHIFPLEVFLALGPSLFPCTRNRPLPFLLPHSSQFFCGSLPQRGSSSILKGRSSPFVCSLALCSFPFLAYTVFLS